MSMKLSSAWRQPQSMRDVVCEQSVFSAEVTLRKGVGEKLIGALTSSEYDHSTGKMRFDYALGVGGLAYHHSLTPNDFCGIAGLDGGDTFSLMTLGFVGGAANCVVYGSRTDPWADKPSDSSREIVRRMSVISVFGLHAAMSYIRDGGRLDGPTNLDVRPVIPEVELAMTKKLGTGMVRIYPEESVESKLGTGHIR